VVLIDAEGLVVGRLASIISMAAARQAQAHLHPPIWIAATMSSWINAAKVVLTGQKRKKKIYYHHTRVISAASRSAAAGAIMAGPFPRADLGKAVERNGAAGPLGAARWRICASIRVPRILTRRSSPEKLDVAKMNPRIPIQNQD